MPTIAEVREKYPQYADLSDEQLAHGLHDKYYSDMPYEQFAQKIGMGPKSQPKPSAADLASVVDPQFGGKEAALNLLSGAVAGPVAGIAGAASSVPYALGLTKTQPGDVVRNVQSAMTYEPRSQAGKQAAAVVNYPFQKLGEFADYAGDATRRGLGGGTTGNVAGTAVNTAIQGLPMLLLRRGAKPAEVAGDVSRPSPVGSGAPRPAGTPETPAAAPAERPAGLAGVPEKAPTKEQLNQAAKDAYKRADESGVVVTADSFSALKKRIADDMQEQGIDRDLHPDSSAALRRITEKEGDLSLKELETLRKIANDAEGSVKPADQRLAGRMVDTLDEYIDNLTEADVVAGDAAKGKALKEARNLYSRKKKADELDRLVARAELSAPNFSGSGMENALRTEFRALAKNERRMRRFTPEERAAIERVAKGGTLENMLRMLGKAAPTGVVSGALSSGAGFLTGGPIGAVALPAAGAAARYAATRMTMANAARANELVRRGPQPVALSPELQQRYLDSLRRP